MAYNLYKFKIDNIKIEITTIFFILQKFFCFISPPTNERKEFLLNKRICADLNLWSINLKFLQNVGHIVFYNL